MNPAPPVITIRGRATMTVSRNGKEGKKVPSGLSGPQDRGIEPPGDTAHPSRATGDDDSGPQEHQGSM